jgi:phage minor structural protein
MFPILYESITVGSVPSNMGLGMLSDAISCEIEQERNGGYTLEMEYPKSGIHAEDLALRRVIKAKPNFTDDPQLFRIDRIEKAMNDNVVIYAKHISYDLSGNEITSGTANSAATACALLQNSASGYTITTDKTVTANFKITEPSSVRSWFGGKSGSFLDVFGTTEIKYNNFNIQFLLHAGQDRGVTIRYGKNLLELSQEIDCSNLYTHVVCFYKNEDTMVIGSKMPTGLTLDVDKTLILDMSDDYEDVPTTSDLTTKATAYINSNNLTVPSNNITLDFVQSGELANRVDLCDTVNVYYEALGITRAEVKCIRTKYDCIREKYIETEFGDAKTDISDSILETSKAVAEKPSVSYMEQAISDATQLITGNLGGYVIMHDSDGDGKPDEILIMDTEDINTATNVWRFNKNGLGHSTSYSGNYALALTADGQIVADRVTTGTMSGNRVRTGSIISQNGQLIMDLDNGTITAPAITLNGQDVESTLDSLVQTSVQTRYALSNSGTVIPSTFPLESPTTPTEQQPFLWSRTIYTYANNQTSTSYGVSVRGNNGQDGQDGHDIEILGSYDTMAELIAAHPTGEVGQNYIVGGDLVVWDDDNNEWKDVGRIQGPSGFDGLWLAIENNDDGTSSNVTYTVRLLKGVTDVTVTYDAVFVWQLVKESGITEIATGTDSITVARDSADYGATIRCICIAILTEEVMEDYSYNTIQDYSGNDIQIIGSNIVKLIGESEIYKPYAISSQFQVMSDQISSKVSQTDFNSLSGTVTTQGTQIQQNANAILLKADTSTVNAGLADKMGKDMSNRSSSILIDSGQIRFDSNSLVVNSSQFTLDASGNATFGGNITASTIKVGSEFVNIGDAIDGAESSAIATAAQDATNKAQAAQDNAVNAASSDASTKATNALNSAKSYTDTGLSGKVGNNEVRTKFAADTHSIIIQSGTVNFKANTLLVDSTQFKLDSSGNATFSGNLTSASLNVGGTATNIGTAINNAANSALSSANSYTDQAELDAVATAAADATSKANAAKSEAISTASSDASTKANNAAKTATNYITKIDNNGIFISPESQNPTTSSQGNSVLINASGMNIYKGSVSVASFGDTARVGKANSSRFLMNATSLQAYNSSNAKYFEVSANGISFGTNTVASTSYADSKANTAQANAKSYTDSTAASTLSSANAYSDQSEADAIASAKTYTDTGLAGKVGNSEIRTKFAADATSVTIESGEIAFRSNTFSVDATNLEITKAGLVTANNFKAKNMFRVTNDSNVVLASIEPKTNGGFIAIGRTDGQQVGTFFATSTGSDLSLGTLSGTETIRLNGGSGIIRVRNTSGKEVATISSDSDGGVFKIRDENANVGYQVACTSEGGGTAVFVDSDNVITIQENGQTGYITCVRVNQTSSRKVKENIKPIEDSEKILELQAVSFDYKNKSKGSDLRGFIAEDVAEILPNLVTPETEETSASLDYIGMIPYLQDIIKKQDQRIKALEEKIDKLMEKEK